MKNETTRVRGRWDEWDSIPDRAASNIFSAEHQNVLKPFRGNGAPDPRAASYKEEAARAIVAALNACSSDVSAFPVSAVEAARMDAVARIDAAAIESVVPNSGADQFDCWLFNR